MLYDDDVSFKEISNALFKFQYSFVHPFEPDVYVIHTMISSTSVFVMVHLLHYLGRNIASPGLLITSTLFPLLFKKNLLGLT